MTDLPSSITTLAQSQLKPGTLHIHVGTSNKQSAVKHNQQSSADILGTKICKVSSFSEEIRIMKLDIVECPDQI